MPDASQSTSNLLQTIMSNPAQNNAPQPTNQAKAHENDILLVYNPDLGCDEEDAEEGWSHKDFFQVKWDGYPHRIAPGESRRMPRFLAEHYAKHLANHILGKRERSEGRIGLLQSPIERPKVLATIVQKVEEYFHGQPNLTVGQAAALQVEKLNEPVGIPLTSRDQELPATDIGEVPNTAVGVLKAEPKPLAEILKNAEETSGVPSVEDGNAPVVSEPAGPTSIYDPSKPRPTKKELLADAYKLGIEVNGKETVDQLIDKIKSFGGK